MVGVPNAMEWALTSARSGSLVFGVFVVAILVVPASLNYKFQGPTSWANHHASEFVRKEKRSEH